jgi:hypothetical protein
MLEYEKQTKTTPEFIDFEQDVSALCKNNS